MRKYLPIIPILLATGLSVATYGALPSLVYPDWSRLFPIDARDEGMGRVGLAVLFPVLSALVWALMEFLARFHGARALPEQRVASPVDRFEPTYHIVVLGVVSLVVLMQVTLVASALAWPEWTFKTIGVTLGAGLFLVGNLMPRVRPNWIVGIRTRATLADAQLWMRTHRYFGGLLMLSGVVVMAIGVMVSRYAFVALVAGFLLSAVAAHTLAGAMKKNAAVVAS